MFEVSFRAGMAGNYQWGLDSGQYSNSPAVWKVGDYVGDDEELEVGDSTIITYSESF